MQVTRKVCVNREVEQCKATTANWLFPELQSVQSAGKKLGTWMRSVAPEQYGGAAKYAHVAVPDLPESIAAGGIRPGGCST